ncbi:unnamed protein product, partial [Porites lobata]
VSPSSLYIKEEWGDCTYWANESGRFNLSNLADGTCLVVMGQSKNSVITSETGNCLSYAAPADTGKSRLPFKPFFRRGKSNSASTFGCKIILAKKNGKSFTELNQTYINVSEDSANVEDITRKVQEKWGNVVLVAGNGLPIQDEEGTRGKGYHESEPSSEEEFGREKCAPKKKKADKFVKQEVKEINEETSMLREELQNNSSTLDECKTMLQELIVVNKFLPLPPCLIKLVSDAFKCKICLRAPMTPPVIATRCCNVLIGCSICTNEWFSGDGGLDKSCPNCREPRGYAQTFQFKGIDDFLKGFKKLMA